MIVTISRQYGAAGLDVAHRLEELTGYMYSTSLLNRAVLRDRSAEFERDLAGRLLKVEPAGQFSGPASYAYELAVAPAR